MSDLPLLPNLTAGTGRQADADIRGDMTRFELVGYEVVPVYQERANGHFWLACPQAAREGKIEMHEHLLATARLGIGGFQRLKKIARQALRERLLAGVVKAGEALSKLAPGVVSDDLPGTLFALVFKLLGRL